MKGRPIKTGGRGDKGRGGQEKEGRTGKGIGQEKEGRKSQVEP